MAPWLRVPPWLRGPEGPYLSRTSVKPDTMHPLYTVSTVLGHALLGHGYSGPSRAHLQPCTWRGVHPGGTSLYTPWYPPWYTGTILQALEYVIFYI